MDSYLAAVVQLGCSSNAEANWKSARRWIERAAEGGAHLVTTPENTNYLGPHEDKVRRAEPLEGPTVSRFRDLAARLGIHLLLGSFNEKSDDSKRCFNTSVLLAPDGSILATYRKLHLFDVDVSPEVRFLESDTIKPGDRTVTVDTPLGKLGFSICYDLRFPELYRQLVDAGAEVLLVPSAFTMTTGRDHWYPLLQARAIETQSYILAPAQWGQHDDGGLRESYGHAAILDPWGQVIASVADGEGMALAAIDRSRVARVRRSMPLSHHRRL